MQRTVKCDKCHGGGLAGTTVVVRCPQCGGTGKMVIETRTDEYQKEELLRCAFINAIFGGKDLEMRGHAYSDPATQNKWIGFKAAHQYFETHTVCSDCSGSTKTKKICVSCGGNKWIASAPAPSA